MYETSIHPVSKKNKVVSLQQQCIEVKSGISSVDGDDKYFAPALSQPRTAYGYGLPWNLRLYNSKLCNHELK